MSWERRWQLLLLLGMSLDFAGAIIVLSAVLDFTGRTYHGQLQQEVDYIDTELVQARRKALIGLWLIVAGFALALGKELHALRLLK